MHVISHPYGGVTATRARVRRGAVGGDVVLRSFLATHASAPQPKHSTHDAAAVRARARPLRAHVLQQPWRREGARACGPQAGQRYRKRRPAAGQSLGSGQSSGALDMACRESVHLFDWVRARHGIHTHVLRRAPECAQVRVRARVLSMLQVCKSYPEDRA
eukprot:6179237-Pleurochrysis_carterae.AAC.4